MELNAAAAGQMIGFSRIPWQLKSCFGLLSDALPICGYRRGPYMMSAGARAAAHPQARVAHPHHLYRARFLDRWVGGRPRGARARTQGAAHGGRRPLPLASGR
mgnify:CR=1 FL=1